MARSSRRRPNKIRARADSSNRPGAQSSLLLAEALVEKLVRALHRYGAPAHRLEEAMATMADRLGLQGQFFCTPTAIFASFGQAGEHRTVLIRVEPGEVHLEKMTRLDGLLSRMLAGELGPRQASSKIDRIVDAPERYSAPLMLLAHALASGSAALLLGGGLRDAAAGATIGLIIGLIASGLGRSAQARRLIEPLAATAAATVGTVLAVHPGGLSQQIAMLSGLIPILPGLSLTVAMKELATRHLVSGTARLAWAGLVFLVLGFGVALGDRLGRLAAGPLPDYTPLPISEPLALALALPAAALAFTVLFRARPRDSVWIFLAGAVGILGDRLGANLLGPDLGALLAALSVGAFSNYLARLRQHPAAITQLPGLILLVPGSLGFRGVASLLQGQTLPGVQAAFSMVVVAVALVTGLLLANVLVPPRRAL